MASSPTSTSPTGKKLVNTKGGLRMICLIPDERSAFEIDEPEWQPDDKHLICNKCGNKFSFKTRRHHCRRCGNVFCGTCCNVKTSLPRLGFVDPQRVCIGCEVIAKKEIDLYERLIPTLMRGSEFEMGVIDGTIVHCKLNTRTHRELLFNNPKDSDEIPHEPVVLQDITSFQCLVDPLQQTREGTGQLVGVNMKYFTNGLNKELKLNVTPSISNRKESQNFLMTLQKAMKMIFDASS